MIFKKDKVEEEYKSPTRYSYNNIYDFNIVSFYSFHCVNLIGSSGVCSANPIYRFHLGHQDVQLVLLFWYLTVRPFSIVFCQSEVGMVHTASRCCDTQATLPQCSQLVSSIVTDSQVGVVETPSTEVK